MLKLFSVFQWLVPTDVGTMFPLDRNQLEIVQEIHMTAGAHDTGEGFGRSAGVNAARGIAVIVGAVLLGVFLMVRGVDDNSVAADETTSTTAPADGETPAATSAPEDVVTTLPADETQVDDTLGAQRNPSEVLTLALNGTSPAQPGLAGSTRDRLQAAGYGAAAPKNADTPGPSVILFVEGFESDARAIAELFGVDPAAVVKPFDAATSPIADTQSANVIVMAGSDGVITP